MPSTITLQSVVNLASTHLDLAPLAGIGGYTNEPALSLCNDVMQTLFAPAFGLGPRPLVLDWKFNRAEMGVLVTAPFKQDYKHAGATIFSLSQGIGIDLASNNALTIASTTVTIKTLEPYNGLVGDVCYITGTGSNYDSTFTQNGSTSSWAGCTYTVTAINGLTITATVSGGAPSGTSGAPGITDFGWLAACTIVDYNNGAPIQPIRHIDAVRDIPPMSQAGAPTKVAVIQDLGTGVLRIRFSLVPGSRPWLVQPIYQKKAPLLTSLSSTWSPIPDELSYVYRQGFLAQCYRYINSPRSEAEEQKFELTIRKALGGDDREACDKGLVPEDGMNTNSDFWWIF
jgi:hypothetical protein